MIHAKEAPTPGAVMGAAIIHLPAHGPRNGGLSAGTDIRGRCPSRIGLQARAALFAMVPRYKVVSSFLGDADSWG